MGYSSFMAPLGTATNNKLTKLCKVLIIFGEVFLCNKSANNGKLGSMFFTTITNSNEYPINNNAYNRREVSADFKNSRHRETTTIPAKTTVKITILNTFYCVTECLPLTCSEKDEFPDCRSCSAVSLAVVRSHRFTQFNKNFRGKWLS